MASGKDKNNPSNLAESPIQEIFEQRHPFESEKQWAEKTLAPTLEKNPEKPIGAPTGVNRDENGNARFTTISGVPIRRLRSEEHTSELQSSSDIVCHLLRE